MSTSWLMRIPKHEGPPPLSSSALKSKLRHSRPGCHPLRLRVETFISDHQRSLFTPKQPPQQVQPTGGGSVAPLEAQQEQRFTVELPRGHCGSFSQGKNHAGPGDPSSHWHPHCLRDRHPQGFSTLSLHFSRVCRKHCRGLGSGDSDFPTPHSHYVKTVSSQDCAFKRLGPGWSPGQLGGPYHG